MLKNTFLDFYNNYVVLRPALPDALVGTPGMGEAVDASAAATITGMPTSASFWAGLRTT